MATGISKSSRGKICLGDPEAGPPQKTAFTPPANERPLNLSMMPPEIILMITLELLPSAQALFAHTCRDFLRILAPLSARIAKADPKALQLRMPREQPSNFQESEMSEPQLYQSERWELLRLWEKDISDRWLLCFDCFILHPVHMFVKPERSLVPWFKDSVGLSGSQRRSCRNPRCPTTAQEAGSYSLCGVVDLCPCFKLRHGKKERIQAALRELEQDNDKHRWCHKCRHVYGDIDLEIKISFFSYEKDGELGVWSWYRLTSPSDSSSVCPRMLCPHIHLDTLVGTLSKCRDLHCEHIACIRCKALRQCKDCHSIISKFTKETDSTGAINLYSFGIERRLDKKLWSEHTIYPFARQRQYNSIRRGFGWKLW